MDIIIINPGEASYGTMTEHLGIASLKSYVSSRGFHAEILDMAIEELSVSGAINKIITMNPKVIGISLLDGTKKKGFNLIRYLRRRGYRGIIVVGGYLATFSAREILRDFPQIDYVVRGEGEVTLVELLQFIFKRNRRKLPEIPGLSYRQNNRTIDNPARPLITDLDVLPPPDRKYAERMINNNSPLRIYATRGCWGNCSFCDIISFYSSSSGKRWRRRSVKRLIDEVEDLVKKYKTHYFIFNDDQFLVKGKKCREYVDEFVKEIDNRNLKINFELMCRADTIDRYIIAQLKSAGLKRVFLGIESFDSRQLQRYRKAISVRQNIKAVIILKQLKVDVIASVILADAYTDLLDLLKQFITLFEVRRRYFNSKHCQISINKKLELYRGSALYQEYQSKGLLTKDDYMLGYDYKLRFGTNLRLVLFTIEEQITNLLLHPNNLIERIRRSIHWQLNTVKSILTSNAKF
jgi:radical SAM superfamily enzyme YgiQ (UPF0313 family)